MLIFVYGEDTFRTQERVQELKEAFLKKFDPTGMNLASFPGGDGRLDPAEVLQAVCSLPFLGSRRLVIVRGLIENATKEQTTMWTEGFSRVPESTVVIFWESMTSKEVEKDALFKKLKDSKDVHVYSYPFLSDLELQKWIVARIKKHGGTIGQNAVATLATRVGPDLWQIANEIQKLIAFAGGKMITEQIIETLVSSSFEGEIFALMDAVSQKKSREALQKLQEERWAGANDVYLLTMLARQIRLLLGARSVLEKNPHATSSEIAKILGMHPYVAGKVVSQAKMFTLDALKEAHTVLFNFDQRVKRGQMDAELATDLLTVRLVQ